MPAASTYDYTKESAAPAEDIDDFEIAQVVAPSKSADEIEKESSFKDIPPGDHELVVIGFLAAPKAEHKSAYVGGKQVGFNAHSVVVKFGLASDQSCQVTDYF